MHRTMHPQHGWDNDFATTLFVSLFFPCYFFSFSLIDECTALCILSMIGIDFFLLNLIIKLVSVRLGRTDCNGYVDIVFAIVISIVWVVAFRVAYIRLMKSNKKWLYIPAMIFSIGALGMTITYSVKENLEFQLASFLVGCLMVAALTFEKSDYVTMAARVWMFQFGSPATASEQRPHDEEEEDDLSALEEGKISKLGRSYTLPLHVARIALREGTILKSLSFRQRAGKGTI